jgi:hypothetical protein
MAVSFINGRNWSTRMKPQTCHKSLTNFITKLVLIGIGSNKSIRSRPRRPPVVQSTLYYVSHVSFIWFISTWLIKFVYETKNCNKINKNATLIEEFEDTKWVIWSCKSKKDRQHNGQNKKCHIDRRVWRYQMGNLKL